jgi:MFS family permease
MRRKIGMVRQTRTFYGWWVVAALFVVGMLGPMARYSITAFGPFISQELGWGATPLGLALSISLWVYAIASVPVGWLIDRFGSQRTLILGGLFLLIGLWGFSKVYKLWELYIAIGVLIGIGVSMAHFLTTQSTARKWFKRRAGLAGGILTAAFWVGAGILSPLLTGMAHAWGWRMACLVYGLGTGLIVILLAKLVIRDTPESMGLHPDGIAPSESSQGSARAVSEIAWDVKEALSTFSFWMIFLGYSLIGLSIQGLLGHLVLWGVELGAAKATAGLFLTAFTFSSALAAVLGGWLADQFGKRRVLGTVYTISGLMLIAAWPIIQSSVSLMLFVALFGLVYGVSAGPGLWSAYVGDLFGRAAVGRLFGILTLGYGLIGGSGPLIWGRIHDLGGGYNTACLISALSLLLIVICIALAKGVTKRG